MANVSTPGQRTHVLVDQVTHQFASGLMAIDRMNFHIDSGEFVVIVGPSGCGKTTIQNIIAGLLPVQRGTVTIAGQPPQAGRKDIAYMFAQDALLPWRTVIDNVLFGVEIHEGRSVVKEQSWIDAARGTLASIGLAGFERTYPRQLSHGMRQRVALARTFMMKSSLLLMDEPFGALDAHTKLTLEQQLLKLWEHSRRTILFITHDLAEAILVADRILICSARPGHIKSEVVIGLPRPRNLNELQESNAYHQIYQRLWSDLSSELWS